MKRQLLFVPVLVWCASASEPTRVFGPVLGYVFDSQMGGVRPILGVPGASHFGEPIGLGIDTSRSAVSSVRGYVLGVSGETGRVSLFRDPGSAAPGVAVEGAAPAPDRIVLSPTGAAAALVYRDRNAIQVLAGLPESPALRGEVSLFGLPEPLSAMAVSDDGGSVLVAGRGRDGRDSLVLLSPGADPRTLGSAGRVAAAVFFAGKSDVIFADSAAQAVYQVRDARGAAEFVLIADGIADALALETTEDNRTVLVAGAKTITALDPQGGTRGVSRCDCVVAGLERLKGDSVFRVTAPTASPSWLFDAGRLDARFLFIPAASADPRAIPPERLLPRPKGGVR